MKKTEIYILSLGCAKNLVNSEQMIHKLEERGYSVTKTPEKADVAIVNTCGFIDSAKSESIEAILSLASLKQTGKLRALIASGCLSQRYGAEFSKELPEVDAVLGTGAYSDICEAVEAALAGKRFESSPPPEREELEGERTLLTPDYSAYLRIAEGCDNRCAYCVIPYIRGRYRSRRKEDIVSEAKALAEKGVRELLVIAQDITRYGTDVYGKKALPELLSELCRIDGIEWIRLHYLYPDECTRELFEVCAREPKILHYFDIPIQHISDGVLKRMNRRGGSEAIKKTFNEIRELMPDAVIRTSLIVGFPGETEKDFETLCDFMREYKLQRAGVFAYSREEGSPAAEFSGQIPEEVKEKRREILYGIQERIMDEWSASCVGKTLKVLCTESSGREFVGRSYMDSPDIDGVVRFTGKNVSEGDLVNVLITGYDACDLLGKTEDER